MTTNIFAFSDKGCILAKKIAELYPDCACFALPKFAQRHNIQEIQSTKDKVREIFDTSQLIIFVGAVGIAVRSIAPFVKSKATDPAVLSVDEKAQFVIPLLSGHIGGANDIARNLAKVLNSVAVITTATDINGKFSVDEWATKNSLYISDMKKAKEISAAILSEDITVKSDFIIKGELPNGLTYGDSRSCFEITYKACENVQNGDNLRLVPKVLTVGIGCKRAVDTPAVESLLIKVLKENNLDINGIKSISSIDIKKDEKAILEVAKKYNIPFITYTQEELSQLKGSFTKSEFVKNVTGTDNVCERSAALSSKGDRQNQNNDDCLLVKKIALNGVTIAIAITNWEVEF